MCVCGEHRVNLRPLILIHINGENKFSTQAMHICIEINNALPAPPPPPFSTPLYRPSVCGAPMQEATLLISFSPSLTTFLWHCCLWFASPSLGHQLASLSVPVFVYLLYWYLSVSLYLLLSRFAYRFSKSLSCWCLP